MKTRPWIIIHKNLRGCGDARGWIRDTSVEPSPQLWPLESDIMEPSPNMTTGAKVIEKITADKRHPFLVCIFCKRFFSDSEFDLDLHLYENHRLNLVKLPIGNGSFDFRIKYAIDQGKKLGQVLKYATKNRRKKLGW